MNVKIHHGTTGEEHLCDKCIHIRTRTHQDGHVERQCSVNSEESSWALIRNSRVVECSVFSESGHTGLAAMYSIAWMWVKTDDGDITFIDQNSRRNPQVESIRPSFRERVRRAWRQLTR